MTIRMILLLTSIILFVVDLILTVKVYRIHGILHVDEYTNKEIYRMVYLLPLETIKHKKRLVLKVETKKWNEEYYIHDEDYEV